MPCITGRNVIYTFPCIKHSI